MPDSYDEIPYDSTPFADTHPDHLCVLGRLFGLATAEPITARILELGCASGGNIIPLAYYLPETKITGIELSAGQVATAQQLIAQLKLHNIEVRQGDIMTLGAGLGEFDYIIAHGVYSWVPEVVRSQILALCRTLLAPHGIAYISYNTLPGWRMRGTLRDMLLHHTRHATTPRARLEGAYQFFDLLEQAIADDNALPSRYLQSEIAGLRKSHPSYLYHEYLEEMNQPFLFGDFVRDVRNAGLNYLCDVELANDIPATLGAGAAAALDTIDDLIEQGQYADFVANRTFRRSLLCRGEVRLQRELSLEQLASLACSAQLSTEKGVHYKQPRAQSFRSPSGQSFDVEHPLTKAALQILAARYPDAIAITELSAAATAKVAQERGRHHAHEHEALLSELLSLFAHQGVRFAPRPRHYTTAQSPLPCLNPLARAQAAMGMGHLATPSHSALSLDGFATRLAQMLDGQHTIEAITATLLAEVQRGELAIPGMATPLEPHPLSRIVTSNVQRLTDLFLREGLLS